jgi:spermidine/putrescine transport system substrate-binding protein/spermidine/putrescine transport system permease protein
VRELVEEDLGEYVDTAFPPEEVYKGQESYSYLGEALDKLYTKLWLQVKVD